jgi:tetratricopeptide (TPR) repeat protein/transglutaminase-like putative cysteine protease
VPYHYDPGILKSVPKEFLEDAPACILYSGVTHMVEPDGTIETTTHEITRLNSRKSLEKLGEYRSITYDPSFEKLTLHEARVLKADGRTVDVEPRHVQLRDQITDYLVYDRDKQVIVSFPKLEVGDVIEVKWTVRGKNPEYHGHFFTRYAFGDDRFPVALDEMRVRLPKDRLLKYASVGGKIEPKTEEEGTWRAYHWQAKNRRELPQDELPPPKEEMRLEVIASTFTSWEEVLQWKRKLGANCWTVSPEVRQVVEQVTRDLKTPLEKARALTYWVRRNIRYVSSGEKHDFTPHPPTRVLANRFGDCKDQSQLLAVMLRQAGIEVSLVTLATQGDGQIVESVPSPLANHAILRVVIDGQEHWIDTTTTLAAWDFLAQEDRGRVCYVVDAPSPSSLLPRNGSAGSKESAVAGQSKTKPAPDGKEPSTGGQNKKEPAPGGSSKKESAGVSSPLFPVLGAEGMRVRELRIARTPEMTPEDNRVEQTTQLAIASDGSSHSQRTSTYFGQAAMLQRDEWLEVPNGERRRIVANELQNSSSQARLSRLNIDDKKLGDFDQPVTARIEFDVPNHFAGDAEREGSLSDSQVWGKLLVINVDYDRQTALELSAPFESVHRYEVALSPVFRFDGLPKESTVRSKWGSFQVRVKPDAKDPRRLAVEFRTRLEKTRVEPADFETFRQFRDAVFKHYRAFLTLTPTLDLADAKLLEDALQKSPGDSAMAVVLARIYVQHGKRAEARRVLESARGHHPNHVTLWELTVQTAQSSKDQEAAYREMVQRFPDPKYRIALGETRINLGDQDGVKQVLEPLISAEATADSWRGQAHYQLARSCLKQNQVQAALEHLEAATRLSPEGVHSVAALQFKGRLHEKLGQLAEAADAYRQALQQEPDSEETLAPLIRLELAGGHRREALDLLRRLTVVVGNQADGLIQAADFHLRLGRYDEAFDLASRAESEASKVSKTSEVCRILGVIDLHRHDYSSAIAHLEKADPGAEVLEGLIRAYVALGKLEEAERQAERVEQVSEATMPLCQAYARLIVLEQRREAIRLECPPSSENAEAWNEALGALVCAERLYETGSSATDVEKLLDRVLKDGREIGPALALRGLLALEKGRLNKAAQDAERAIHLTPQEARGYYVRGRVRLEREQKGALDDLTRATELSRRRDAAILHWLAAAQFHAGKTDEAVATEQEAIKLNGHDPEFQQQLQEFQKSMKAVIRHE